MQENLTFYEPTEEQLVKFRRINELHRTRFEFLCVCCDDCSICDMAIHQHLLSTTKNTCTYGMTEEKFCIIMSDADCEY